MPHSCRLIHIILITLLLVSAQVALAELRCRNLDGIPPGDPNPGDPTDQIHKLRIGMKLEPGTTVIMGGLVDGDQSATIQTAPLGENALIIPTCDQKTFIYKWYTEQRFKANSFPTFARQCNYTNDPVADQPGADQTIRVLRQEPYVDWDRNMNTLKMDCNTIQQSAFLVLPEYYTLTQSSMLTPRVGPYGYEKGDARDPNAFLWPINDRISRIFTVYEYPKEEGWQKLFPINKRVCIARGQIPFEQIPTVNVTSSEVILQLVNAEKNGRDEFSAGISCRTVDPGANICAPAVGGRAAMSTVSVEAIGNFRMRALKKGSTTQIIDSRGTHFTTKFDVSCGTDVQMLFDWFHPATRLPSSGQAWDDSIIPMRRTMCTYSGWSAEGTSRIRLGGPTSNEQADLESSSSAWNNHNLAPMEWFSCKDIPVAEAGGSKNGVSFVALLSPSKSHGQSEGRNTVRRVRRRSDVLV